MIGTATLGDWPAGLADIVACADGAVADLLDQLRAGDPTPGPTPLLGLLTDEQLLAAGEAVERLIARVVALQRLVIAVVEKRQAADRAKNSSTRGWLRETLGYTARQASSLVKQATETVALPVVWAGLAEATVAPRQVDAIINSFRYLPVELDSAQQRQAEQIMVQYAAQFDPQELAVVGNRLVEVIDPQHADEIVGAQLQRQEVAARLRRGLFWRSDGLGSLRLKGSFPLVEGEQLVALLDAMVDRTRRDSAENESGSRGAEEDGLFPDEAAGEGQYQACGPSCPGPGCALCGGRPTVSMLRADALMELAWAYADSQQAPLVGGDRPRLLVTVTKAELAEGLPGATGEGSMRLGGVESGRSRSGAENVNCFTSRAEVSGERVSTQAARQLACDCSIVPMVLDDFGVPLAVGRERRLYSNELRAALAVRDGGCAFPGCDRPVRLCEAHHIKPWWWGGETSLDNGVLLCKRHHALVEPSRNGLDNPNRWEVRLNPVDRLPEFLPPQALDRERTPRRQLRHRLRA